MQNNQTLAYAPLVKRKLANGEAPCYDITSHGGGYVKCGLGEGKLVINNKGACLDLATGRIFYDSSEDVACMLPVRQVKYIAKYLIGELLLVLPEEASPVGTIQAWNGSEYLTLSASQYRILGNTPDRDNNKVSELLKTFGNTNEEVYDFVRIMRDTSKMKFARESAYHHE